MISTDFSWKKLLFVCIQALTVLMGDRGHGSRARTFGSKKGPRIWEKKSKRRFFDFNQKKETRRKGINASQLAIINFNITGKHMNTHEFLFLRVFSLKTKTFQAHFWGKRALLSVIQLAKNMPFSCTAH